LLFGNRPLAVVAAFSRDKRHASILRALGRAATRFTLTQFAGERSTPVERLLAAAPTRHIEAEAVPNSGEAIDRARAWAKARGGALLVTGSFYLIAEAIAHLHGEVPRAL
jgi:folylpolyglutamate synthase/dihydropteroate synthase